MTERREPPPIRVILPLILVLFAAASLIIIFLLGIPWILPIPLLWSVGLGIVFLAAGFPMMAITLQSLTVRRAFGYELYTTKEESHLVTTGPYAYTRNPLYFSGVILLIGWILVLRLTCVLIVALLFLPLFVFAAKWEEDELAERFGEEYFSYKEQVPFFFPRRRRE